MNDKVDLNNISAQLDDNLNRTNSNSLTNSDNKEKKFFKKSTAEKSTGETDKKAVQAYSSILLNTIKFPNRISTKASKKKVENQLKESNNVQINGNKNTHIDANGQIKANQQLIRRCPQCTCAIYLNESCKHCCGIEEIKIIDDREIEHNLNNRPFRNSNKSTNINNNNNQQLNKMSTTQNITTTHISCNNFYSSKENSSATSPKSSKNTSLLNISTDCKTDEKTKYDVDYLYIGTYRFISRSFFRIDSNQITLNLATKDSINIDYKLINKLMLSEGKVENIKFVFIRIFFVEEAVKAINDFIEKLPDNHGVFKHESINGHERYFVMKLKYLQQEDVIILKKRLKLYLLNNYKEDQEVFKIFNQQRDYCFASRNRKKQKTSNKEHCQQQVNSRDNDEMQIDDSYSRPLSETVKSTYSRTIEKISSSPSMLKEAFNSFTGRYTFRNNRQPSIKSLDQEEEMEISEIKPKFQLPFKNIKKNKIKYDISNDDQLVILKTDLFCLNDGNFLNDKIIEFYFMYIKSRLISSEIRDKTYIFSSFFFTKMISLTRGQLTEEQYFENQYNLVKNWTKNIDIFKFDYLVIPIFRNYHWSLALICFPGKVLENSFKDDIGVVLDEDEEDEPLDRPCIIFMDSMGKSNLSNKFSKFLRNFLRKECGNKKDLNIEFNDSEMQTLKPEVPNQLNGYDCGIFILHYVETFLKNPLKVIEKIKTSKTTLKFWFESASLKDKRKDIFTILYEIYEDNLKNNAIESDEDTTLKSDEEIEILTNSNDKDIMMSDDEDK